MAHLIYENKAKVGTQVNDKNLIQKVEGSIFNRETDFEKLEPVDKRLGVPTRPSTSPHGPSFRRKPYEVNAKPWIHNSTLNPF